MAIEKDIAAAVADAGGRAYYVGGYVRDRLLGKDAKDVDIEIHGIEYSRLVSVLSSFGTVRTVGSSFGVFGLDGYDLDIAMPRSERATGRGHKDFEIYTDPFIGTQKASRRRDFTINAMMEDVLTGEVLDYWGGLRDLEDKVIRHIAPEAFAEDPLRVLRAAQFSARFEFVIAPETLDLCRGMDLTSLSRERVAAETDKALMKAEHPSVYFKQLREMEQLSFWFPELDALIGVPQNPTFHPEGDVWNHTMAVLDIAAGLRAAAVSPRAFMYAALCHDMGKPSTTETVNGAIHSYRHDTEGRKIAVRFIRRLSSEAALASYVSDMTEKHMRPNIMVEQGASDKAFMRLFDSSCEPVDLLLLSKADRLGSAIPGDYAEAERYLAEELEKYRELMTQPYVQGRDLVEAGVKPGPEFHAALELAHKLRLAGVCKREALCQTLGFLNSLNEHKSEEEK